MIRTLLVDDEPLFREGFRKTVRWNSLGFEIVGEAIDGKEAVEMLQNLQVDLIFTDIRMPVMDGLNLISEIRKKNNPIYIVVLSAYNDFALVRHAFRIGANDYLLKDDFDDSDIMHIAEDLSEYHGTGNSITTGTRDRVFEERVLFECIAGTLDPSAYVSLSEPDKIHTFKGLSVAAIRIDTSENEKIPPSLIRTVCTTTATNCEMDCCPAPKISDVYVLAVREQTERSREARITLFEHFRQQILKQLLDKNSEQFPASPVITIGISGGNDIYNLEHYWKECYRALRSSVIWGYGGIITPEQAASREYSGYGTTDQEQRIHLLSNYIENWDFLNLPYAIKDLILNPHFCTIDQIPKIRELFHSYYILLSLLLNSCPAVASPDFRSCLDRYKQFESQEQDLPTLNNWLRVTINTLAATIGGSSQLVRKVVARIHQKYATTLSIRALALYFSVNPSYLSRICASELGMPLSEYITRVRIKRACTLIKLGRKKIYEIAEAVGFPNQETFTRAFKRIQGIAPKDFFAAQNESK